LQKLISQSSKTKAREIKGLLVEAIKYDKEFLDFINSIDYKADSQ
jgi:hypothetical protein